MFSPPDTIMSFTRSCRNRIAVVVAVTGVAGLEPAVVGRSPSVSPRDWPSSRACSAASASTARRPCRRARPRRSRGRRSAPRPTGTASRTNAEGAAGAGIVVFGVELRDRARGLGQAVDLDELAAEHIHRLREHGVGDRRRAVDDRPQRREVGARRRSGVDQQELDHRGHDERVRHPELGDQLEEARRIDVAQHHGLATVVRGRPSPSPNRRCGTSASRRGSRTPA